EFQKLCGGCRARPLARDDNLMGEDFLCNYQPAGGAIIETFVPATGALQWSPEAEQRLTRIPGFVRRMVRRRAEEHVREHGRSVVTADDLALLARQRFGADGPPRFAGGPRQVKE
ncbi:MAG: pyrroloquinoline quinone biosynthesis protein PqqE, partial [Alphaproteobacteria bacterium]